MFISMNFSNLLFDIGENIVLKEKYFKFLRIQDGEKSRCWIIFGLQTYAATGTDIIKLDIWTSNRKREREKGWIMLLSNDLTFILATVIFSIKIDCGLSITMSTHNTQIWDLYSHTPVKGTKQSWMILRLEQEMFKMSCRIFGSRELPQTCTLTHIMWACQRDMGANWYSSWFPNLENFEEKNSIDL